MHSQISPTLFIVPTPIGNLSDFSPRAREILSSVAFITCEDTRHTAKLLAHFSITTSTVSLHEHNEKERATALIQRLLESPQRSAAIVTDAGTPCISDPGAIFVDHAHQAGVHVVSIPGPSALTSGLAASGFLQPRQIFSAFLARTAKEQIEEFSRWSLVAPCVAVFFESPQRIQATLKNIHNHFGEHLIVCVSREISKMHEEHLRGTASEILAKLETRSHSIGECVVSVHLTNSAATTRRVLLSLEEAITEVQKNVEQGTRLKEAIRKVAEENKLDAKILYKRLHMSSL